MKTLILEAFDQGTPVKLSGPPAVVRGRKPVVEHLPHPASKTSLTAWVANGEVYVSRASSTPSPLVGFWKVGKLP